MKFNLYRSTMKSVETLPSFQELQRYATGEDDNPSRFYMSEYAESFADWTVKLDDGEEGEVQLLPAHSQILALQMHVVGDMMATDVDHTLPLLNCTHLAHALAFLRFCYDSFSIDGAAIKFLASGGYLEGVIRLAHLMDTPQIIDKIGIAAARCPSLHGLDAARLVHLCTQLPLEGLRTHLAKIGHIHSVYSCLVKIDSILECEDIAEISDLGHGVTLAKFSDGTVAVEGQLLTSTAPMLENIFKLKNAASEKSEVPRWASSFPLTQEDELTFFEDVMKRRLPAVAANEDQMRPIPSRWIPIPEAFRPTDYEGNHLKGPYTAGITAKPHNVGRQYFSLFDYVSEDLSKFIWADGTLPFSKVSGQRKSNFERRQAAQAHINPCEMGYEEVEGNLFLDEGEGDGEGGGDEGDGEGGGDEGGDE